jgi:anti-sigma-K factor RskA
MTSHDWFVEHRTAFVVRSLEPDEEQSFAEHLAGCEECGQEVARMERELAWLPMGTRPASVRPGLNRRLADRVLGYSRWRWNHLTTAATAAALVLAVIGFAAGRMSGPASGEDPEVLRSRLASSEAGRLALLDTLSVLRGASRIVRADFQMENKPGGLFIFADERTHRWNVVVHGPPAGPDEKYQFWFITDDGMVRGAVVHPDTTGPAVMTMDMPPTGGNVRGAALTVEPMDSATSTPRGRELVHLIL